MTNPSLASFTRQHLALAADWWWCQDFELDTLQVSTSVGAVLGYAATELTTTSSWANIVHEADLAELQASIRKAARSHEVVESRVRFRTRTGGWKPTICRMQAWYDACSPKIPRGVFGISRKVEDVQIESELHQRTEDLSQVASVLSHDFRGPARHIAGCTERVVETLHDPPEARKWAALAHKSALRLGKMIDHVLQYSRAGTKGLAPEDVDVGAVLEDVLRDYADRIHERNVQITARALPVVHYDSTMLYLLIANLLSNAIKFSKKDDASPRVEVHGRNTVGHWASIAIRDHGIGFSPSQRERILDMGFRLHHESDYPGFGYGLAIVRRILNRCGGELGVRSVVGEGSEFVLKLPTGRMVAE